MRLYSHPRSGTNYLRALMEEAFTGKRTTDTVPTGHWSDRRMHQAPARYFRGGHQFYSEHLQGPRIYLYRDGRDVALSMWRTKSFQAAEHRGLSFSEYLRLPLDWYETPGKRSAKGLTIVEHWRAQLDSWQGREALYVRYADLLADPAGQLERIARYTDRPLVCVPAEIEGQGPDPSGDYRAEKWREAFTEDDLTYFFALVPDDYWGLNG